VNARIRGWLVSLAVAATAVGGSAFADESLEREDQRARPDPKPAPPGWCDPTLETLPKDVCYAKGPTPKTQERTLVIFLHGLTQVDSGWQYTLQRGMVLAGKRHGFSLLVPRGRTKVGPGKKADVIAWPINPSVRAVEDEVIAEWMDAKDLIEKREGAPFDEVFVMGFSNGAYYASSLALRGKLDVDGYGVFAGGSAPKGTVKTSKNVKNRRPVFLAIASNDETAKKGRELGKALKKLKWPHRVATAPVGHVVSDGQLAKAVEFLRDPTKKASSNPKRKASDEPKKTKKSKKKSKSKKKAK
jgi:predicted esterase